ncbi:MAG: hypothetical protein ABWZ75_05150 [Novosphingobium sp.]
MASALLFVHAEVLAQDADHTDRGDAADFREHEEARPEPYEVGLDGTPQPSWSLRIESPVLLDTNPFWARDGSKDAMLVVPSLEVAYRHPQLFPGWDLELRGGGDADIFSRNPDELNEGRLDARATIFHPIENAGTLSFGVRARWVYVGQDLNDFDHAQQRYHVSFAPDLPDAVWASVSAEYRDASDAGEKRFTGTANLDWTMVENQDVRLSFFQEFAFSGFTGGTNDGRRDLLSLSEMLLTPGLRMPDGVRLGLAVSLFHRFSNRESSRFTAVQVGPRVGFRF